MNPIRALAPLALLWCDTAMAAQLQYDLSGVLLQDDNLFRRPSSERRTLPGEGRDTLAELRGSANLKVDLGAFDVAGRASLRQSWYARNEGLDNFGYDAGITANYNPARGSLTLGVARLRRLSSFDDVRRFGRNLQTLTTASAQGSYELIGDVRLVGGAALSQSASSSAALAVNDYRRIGYTIGLGYYSPAGNILALEGTIDRVNGLNDRIALIGGVPVDYSADSRDRTIALRVLWQPSVIWRTEGRIGYTDHDDRSAFASDFGGVTGRLAVTWSPLDTLALELRANRSFESNSGLFSNGIRSSVLAATVTGRITPKLTLKATASRDDRAYRYDTQADNPLQARDETLDSFQMTLAYQPLDRLLVTLEATHDTRDSSLAFYRYSATRFGSTATLSLGARPGS